MAVSAKQIEEAVESLKLYVSKKESDKLDILESKQTLQLQFVLKQIPKMKSKLVKLKLPSSQLTKTSDVCLFVKDINPKSKNAEESVLHFKDLLAEKNEHRISEVLPLKALKDEYKPFEAKRKLANSYSVFLADERIVRLLPEILGKAFYGRGRYPIQVNVEAGNLQAEIDRALHTVICNLGTKGPSFLASVAHTEMSTASAVDNVTSAISQLMQAIPGGENNVRGIYLKTDQSPSLPLYISDDFTSREVPVAKKQKLQVEPEQIATLSGAKVLVTATGRVKIIGDGDAGAAANHAPRQSKNKRSKKARNESANTGKARNENGKTAKARNKTANSTKTRNENGKTAKASNENTNSTKVRAKAVSTAKALNENGKTAKINNSSSAKKQKVKVENDSILSSTKQERKRKRSA